ncbi:MAG: CotH kinase family protein [Muribaculaceae bacterium]|nr:CotH kinase family protein [Muribaculaceae bacterium]
MIKLLHFIFILVLASAMIACHNDEPEPPEPPEPPTPVDTIDSIDSATYSGTLPVLFINTEGHRDIVSRDKADYLQAEYWLDNMGIEGVKPIGSKDAPLRTLIKGHGNYTWRNYPKKSYRLKLDDKQPLMGMPKNRHFVLLAHYDDFLARMKNTMGFELSRRIGLAYTPAQQPVELVINGKYMGLYFLTEKVRVGKQRVNIEEQSDYETDPAKITGGWLLEIDNNPNPGEYIYMEEKYDSYNNALDTMAVSYLCPEELSSVQESWLKNYLKQVNAAIYTADKNSTEWERYIDIDTLAMFYIVGEIMDDMECFAGSCYMYKRMGEDTKLIFGPVWDFGNSYQRWAIYGDTQFNKFIYEQPSVFNFSWIEEISKFPHFQEVLRQHWREFYGSGFNGLDIDSFTDEFVESIRPAVAADSVVWPRYSIDIQKNDFKIFFRRKVAWLNEQWGQE